MWRYFDFDTVRLIYSELGHLSSQGFLISSALYKRLSDLLYGCVIGIYRLGLNLVLIWWFLNCASWTLQKKWDGKSQFPLTFEEMHILSWYFICIFSYYAPPSKKGVNIALMLSVCFCLSVGRSTRISCIFFIEVASTGMNLAHKFIITIFRSSSNFGMIE